MSAETDFRALLAAHAPLTALVATRIAQDAVGEGDGVPLVIFSARHEPLTAVDGSQVADQVSFVVQCWADTGAAAAAVADAVQGALATAPLTRAVRVLDRSTTFEPDLGQDGVILTVEWWA